MIVYKDLISSDEMITDAFTQNPVMDNDGTIIEGLFEVESKMKIKAVSYTHLTLPTTPYV